MFNIEFTTYIGKTCIGLFYSKNLRCICIFQITKGRNQLDIHHISPIHMAERK